MTKEQVARIERLLLFQAEMLHLMQADMQFLLVYSAGNHMTEENHKIPTPRRHRHPETVTARLFRLLSNGEVWTLNEVMSALRVDDPLVKQLSVNSSLHKNSKGETPVFRWVGPGRYQMAQSLLGNGAQPVPRAPPATGDGGTYADRAFEILKRTPDAGFGVMASELYGQDTADTRHKVRALINNLYKHGKIRSTARGKSGRRSCRAGRAQKAEGRDCANSPSLPDATGSPWRATDLCKVAEEGSIPSPVSVA